MTLRLLIVTREASSDRRYGLGKSIEPVRAELERHGVYCRYLAREDAGVRGWRWLRRVHRILAALLCPVLRGTDVDSLLWGVLERLNMGRLAARVATREDFTHVHCHDPLIGIGLRWAAPRASRRRFQWGISEHGFGSYTQALHQDGACLGMHVTRLLRARETRILMAARWVVAPTRMSLEQLVRDLGLPAMPGHWHAVPHPLPQRPAGTQAAARTRLGWDMHGTVVLAVGRLAPLKRFDMVVRVFAAAAASSSARLVILGDGEADTVFREAERQGVRNRVQVATADAIWPYYAAADVYLSASSTESFGLANLEALAAGLPVICTSVGGVPEVVGPAAVLVPPEDEAAATCMLGYLLENAPARDRLSELGRRRGAAWPQAEEVARAYLAIYRGETPIPPGPPAMSSAASVEAVAACGRSPATPMERFRALQPLEISAVARVLVVAPHADDESLGCGGTLAALAAHGVEVVIVVVTDGRLGDPEGLVDGDTVALRRQEARAAARVLGVSTPEFLDFPDGALAHDDALEQALASRVQRYAPDWIFAPAPYDAHRDHVVTAQAVQAIRSRVAPRARLFCYETWVPLQGNRIVDITETLETKLSALRCYTLPLRYCDYAGAAEGLARYRGMQLDRRDGAAEVFEEMDRSGASAGHGGAR